MKHHAALRKLAMRWIRILFGVWDNGTAYDPAACMTTIQRKNPAIIPFLPPPQVETYNAKSALEKTSDVFGTLVGKKSWQCTQ